MMPTIAPGSLVCAVGLGLAVGEGDVVIICRQGKEMIKRIKLTDQLRGVFVEGDNPAASTDSRTFGWLEPEEIIAKVVWPRV